MLPFADERPWARLASDVMSTLPLAVRPFAAVLSMVEKDGERRDLLRYEVEEAERGNEGRRVEAGEADAGKDWST